MTPFSPVYRDDAEGARVRYEDLLARWNERRPELVGASGVYARRIGRVWAGNAGIVCAVALAAVTLTRSLIGGGRLVGAPTGIVAGAWMLMLLALLVGRAAARVDLRVLVEPPAPTTDVREDAQRLADAFARRALRDGADALERKSVSRPMIAIVLLAPLTIHLLVWALVKGGSSIESFDGWIGLSLLIVGHAHLTLAYYGWCFAKDARALSTYALAQGAAGKGWLGYGVTVGVSAIPGALLLLLPPILTAVTGLLFVRPLFGVMTRAIVRERAVLGVVDPRSEAP